MVFVTKPMPAVQKFPGLDLKSAASSKGPAVSLEGAHTNLVGLIFQLAAFSQGVSTVMNHLVEESARSYARLRRLESRVQSIKGAISTHENGVAAPFEKLFNAIPAQWNRKKEIDDAQIFQRATRPQLVKELYDQSAHPPALSLLSPLMEDKSDPLKMYTNPDFFIEQWIKEQAKLREEAKEARRKRREQQGGRRTRGPASNRNAAQANVRRLRKVIFDPTTGQKIEIVEEVPVSSAAAPEPTASTALFTGSTTSATTSVAPPPNARPTSSNASSTLMASSGSSSSSTPHITQPSPSASSSHLPAPVSAPTPASAQQPTQASASHPSIPAPQHFAPQPESNPTPLPGPQTVAPVVEAPAPPPAPAAPPPPTAPVPPPAPNMASGPLQKVAVTDTRSTLMDAIRMGKELKSTAAQTIEKKPKEEEFSVTAILARRIAIVGDSDDEDEDDDEWDD